MREFLGATGKAKSTISDLLYGARLDEDRYQLVMCSENVFRAIADLRKRKRASDVPPPVDPAPQITATDDGRKPQENGALEHQSVTESAPSVNNVASQPLEESRASDQHVEPATQSETDATEMLPARNGSVAERPASQSETDVTEMLPARNGSIAERPVDPVAASKWASWRDVESGLTEPRTETEASTNPSEHSDPESGEPMIMDPRLCVALAECAQTDEEKATAGDWSLAMVRPSGSRNVAVDQGLTQSAIAEIQRRCTGE